MIGNLPPGILLIVGGLLAPLLRGRIQKAFLLLLPIAGFVHLLQFSPGEYGHLSFLDYTLTPVRVDRLSLVFGYLFHLAALVGMIYALHVDDPLQHAAAFVYAGSAIGGVFAGDLISLFVFWETAAISSVFLIWARRTPRSARAGMRYLVFQIASGVLLLAGTVLHVRATGSAAFDHIGLGGPGGPLILLSFGIKCGFPFFHMWLTDAYPESTPTGMVFLSSFTTKLAVYALARGFEGTHELIWAGAVMTAFPIFYAVIENDLRRVLGFSMVNQLGFMVVGVGLGGDLGINGAVAHAFADVLFKGTLLMAMGAVLLRTGTCNGSDLGGLYKSMPWTATCCIIGAASISAFPLFSAFVTKSLILAAVTEAHLTLLWFVLLFASAGVFHHAGIKIPFFAFFAHDAGIRVREAPWNMRIAMGIGAALCVAIGCLPGLFYPLLPRPVAYTPYTTAHVVNQLQLLFFSAMAFALLKWSGLYPPEMRSVNLDADWTYRRLIPAGWRHLYLPLLATLGGVGRKGREGMTRVLFRGDRTPRAPAANVAVLVIVLLLLVYLIFDYWKGI